MLLSSIFSYATRKLYMYSFLNMLVLKFRGRGHLKPPLWSMANIKCVAADITHGTTIFLHGMVSILSDMPDILHVQHQFF